MPKTIGNRKGDARLFEVTNTTWENLQLAKHKSARGVNDTDLCIAFWRFSDVVFFTSNSFTHTHTHSLFLLPIVFGINLSLICHVIRSTWFKSAQSLNVKKKDPLQQPKGKTFLKRSIHAHSSKHKVLQYLDTCFFLLQSKNRKKTKTKKTKTTIIITVEF